MDWGPKGNMEEYGQATPPPYNLTTVTAPVTLFWGENDWLATPKVTKFRLQSFNLNFFKNSFEIFFKDVTWLAKRLGNLQGFYRVNFSEFNHLDFLWATNVDELLYYPLLQLLPTDY